jgi:rubrerythrin
MTKTTENLHKALSGEAQACTRYLGFAKKADLEGYPGVARLFRAASMAEKVHAKSHQNVLQTDDQVVEDLHSEEKLHQAIDELHAAGAIKSTMENLQSAIDDENFEFKKMYPAMIRDAITEQQLEARHSLEYAMSIEMIHAKLFKKALAAPENNEVATYFICPLCGYTVASKPPDKCPYCGFDHEKFHAVR